VAWYLLREFGTLLARIGPLATLMGLVAELILSLFACFFPVFLL